MNDNRMKIKASLNYNGSEYLTTLFPSFSLVDWGWSVRKSDIGWGMSVMWWVGLNECDWVGWNPECGGLEEDDEMAC